MTDVNGGGKMRHVGGSAGGFRLSMFRENARSIRDGRTRWMAATEPIFSARQARRTRTYISTVNIHLTLHGLLINLIDDGGRYSFPERRPAAMSTFEPPTWPTLPPPLTILPFAIGVAMGTWPNS